MILEQNICLTTPIKVFKKHMVGGKLFRKHMVEGKRFQKTHGRGETFQETHGRGETFSGNTEYIKCIYTSKEFKESALLFPR